LALVAANGEERRAKQRDRAAGNVSSHLRMLLSPEPSSHQKCNRTPYGEFIIYNLQLPQSLVPSFNFYKMLEPWQQVAVHGVGSIKQGMDVRQQGGLRKPFGGLPEIEITEAPRHYFVRMLIRSKRPHRLEKAEAHLGQEPVPPVA